jgi:hypothetical protein
MITGWFQRALSFSARMRGTASAVPPGGNGTTMRTARLGYVSASTACDSSIPSNSKANRMVRILDQSVTQEPSFLPRARGASFCLPRAR